MNLSQPSSITSFVTPFNHQRPFKSKDTYKIQTPQSLQMSKPMSNRAINQECEIPLCIKFLLKCPRF